MMENKTATDYISLKKNGLQLPEKDFRLILDALMQGVNEAKKYLNVASDHWPKFIFQTDAPVLGYSAKDDAISISLEHLNQSGSWQTPLEYKDQLLCFMPDVFYIIVKYIYWLRLLGREATVHRYQKIGNSFLKKKFPKTIPASISQKALILSDIEVEARAITDAIAVGIGETPTWNHLDAYFAKNHAEYYNKSLEELGELPKLLLPISFEMEYYII